MRNGWSYLKWGEAGCKLRLDVRPTYTLLFMHGMGEKGHGGEGGAGGGGGCTTNMYNLL